MWHLFDYYQAYAVFWVFSLKQVSCKYMDTYAWNCRVNCRDKSNLATTHVHSPTHTSAPFNFFLSSHTTTPANKILPIKTAMYPCLHISSVGTELLQTPRCTPPILIVKWGVEGNIIACLNAWETDVQFCWVGAFCVASLLGRAVMQLFESLSVLMLG